MDEDLKKSIRKGRDLWHTARHAAMATVNADGSPHNTPFHFIPDPEFKYIYWASYPEALHSQNILHAGQIFVVVYDAIDAQKGGLYIHAENGHALEGDELLQALAINNRVRAQEGKSQVTTEYYSGDGGQRMWSARIIRIWINNATRDAQGHTNKDSRQEISIDDLRIQN